MSILETEVLIAILNNNARYYDNIGYEIKKEGNKLIQGTKILVKVEDLPNGTHTKVTKICDDCGCYTENQSYCDILKNRKDGKDRCRSCGNKHKELVKRENIDYENSLEYYAKENNKEYLLEEFSDKNNKKPNKIYLNTNITYLWNCPDCGSEYDMPISQRTTQNQNCPYCAGMRVNHTNCLWTTHPKIADMLMDKEDGYKVTKGSNKSYIFKCKECGNTEGRHIRSVINKGFSCSKCSDGLSYPEKFMMNILDQLSINYEREKIFKWSKKENNKSRKYDFYIPSLNCIIETHGGQHYDGGFENLGGRNLIEEQENDRLKEKLAKENGIEYYIVIDCRYSELSFIKDNILKSRLNNLLNLSSIDWLKCHEYSISSIVKISCDLWNSGIRSTVEIGKSLKMVNKTISKYLKQGVELGWCDYDPKEAKREAMRIGSKKGKKPVIQFSLSGKYLKEWEISVEAGRSLNIYKGSISAVCRGDERAKTAGGFIWKFKSDHNDNKKDLIINKKIKGKHKSPVIQLSLNYEFIKEWESIREASDYLEISDSSISNVCTGRKKTAAGFNWIYKEDYEKQILNYSIL